jgi:hypothetical protein
MATTSVSAQVAVALRAADQSFPRIEHLYCYVHYCI